MKKVLIVLVALLVAAAVTVGVYTRPMTLERLYPELDLSQATLVYGTFSNETSQENRYKTEPGTDTYAQVLEKLQTHRFRRTLQNLFPSEKEKQPVSDVSWTVVLRFPDTMFPGDVIRQGDLLSLVNSYGHVHVLLPYSQETLELIPEDAQQFVFDVWSAILLSQH